MGFLSSLFSKKPKADADAWLQKREAFLASRRAEFFAELSAVPLFPVSVDETAKLLRQRGSDMPDVKFSPVGPSFDKSKLGAFIVIDTETTGLKSQTGRIVELSAILYNDFSPVSAFTTLVNPGKPIPTDATEIHGITDADVESAPTLAQVAASFIDFVGGYPVAGYNLPFDLKFLYCSGVDLVSKRRKFYDVLPICRKAYKDDLDTFSLDDVAEVCQVFRDSSHRSLSDCLATGKVFSCAIDDIAQG